MRARSFHGASFACGYTYGMQALLRLIEAEAGTETMRPGIRMFIAGVLLTAMLPVTVWAYGMFDYPADRQYLPYSGSEGGYLSSGSLRLQTGMTADGYYIRANIQGSRPENVRVYLRRNRVVLQITQHDRHEQYGPGGRTAARWQMRFRRQVRLPYDADAARMTTSMLNGILEIRIPGRRP